MPKRKEPPKLERLCLLAVASYLKQLNAEDRPEDFVVFNDDTNPLRSLPAIVLQELLSEVGTLCSTVSKDVMRVLLCRKMDRLDLSLMSVKEKDTADVLNLVCGTANHLHTLSLMCYNLHTLYMLSYNKKVYDEQEFVTELRTTGIYQAMFQLLRSLANVTDLDFHDLCFDEMLDVVGASCPQLRALRTSSKCVTDKGLKSLCVDPVSGRPRCQKLRKIVMDPLIRFVTAEGVLFLLRHLPCLTELECYSMGKALVTAHETDFRTTDVTYPLRQLMHDGRDCSSSLVADIVLRTCIYVTTLTLVNPTDDALVILGRLRCLEDVTILVYVGPRSVYGGVLPLLSQAGTKVTRLVLTMSQIDLGAINEYCPRLQTLECRMVEEIADADRKNEMLFANLTELAFSARSPETLSAKNLKRLLCHCPQLQHLYLCECKHLTDGVLMDILHVNPLKKLFDLNLRYFGLTFAGIVMFVDRVSELRRISLLDESGDYRTTVIKIRERIQQCNLDLLINGDAL